MLLASILACNAATLSVIETLTSVPVYVTFEAAKRPTVILLKVTADKVVLDGGSKVSATVNALADSS